MGRRRGGGGKRRSSLQHLNVLENVSTHITITSLTKSTFIIAAQSPTGETGGGGGTIVFFLPCYQTVY